MEEATPWNIEIEETAPKLTVEELCSVSVFGAWEVKDSNEGSIGSVVSFGADDGEEFDGEVEVVRSVTGTVTVLVTVVQRVP